MAGRSHAAAQATALGKVTAAGDYGGPAAPPLGRAEPGRGRAGRTFRGGISVAGRSRHGGPGRLGAAAAPRRGAIPEARWCQRSGRSTRVWSRPGPTPIAEIGAPVSSSSVLTYA
ncbi:hypothetical protein TBS_19870 [Thermobispora bispora]